MSQKEQKSLSELAKLKNPISIYCKLIRTVLESQYPVETFTPKLLGLLRARDFVGLLDWADGHVQQTYSTPESYFRAHQLCAFIRKYPFSEKQAPGLNPEEAAVKKFLTSEHRCKWTNRRFLASRKCGQRHADVFKHARKWILQVLGDHPPLIDFYERCTFTGGSSFGVHGDKTNLGRKLLAETWTCTPGAFDYVVGAFAHNDQLVQLLPSITGWFFVPTVREVPTLRDRIHHKVKFVQNNIISFVPKTARTHRSIAIEPLLNGYLQAGIESVIVELLKTKGGIDLGDQTPNQRMALAGSQGGFDPYATIDLESASDSVSIELCRELLPPDWFSFLNRLRSPSYEMDGRIGRYEKFFSMGNGFCFPIQTLVYAALARGVYCVNGQSPDLRVYGDDIIVRQNVALHLIEVLRWCGLRTNTNKTFVFGPFRESCGADWYNGLDVRPVYCKEVLQSVSDLYSLHNLTLERERTQDFFEDARLMLRNAAPNELRFVRRDRRPSQLLKWKQPWGGRKGPSYERSLDTSFYVCQDVYLSSEHTRWSVDFQTFQSRELLSESCRDVIDSPLQSAVEYLAVLGGSSSSVPLALRRTTKLRTRWI